MTVEEVRLLSPEEVDSRISASTSALNSGNISDFTEAVEDAVAGLLAGGTGVTVTYDDAGNTLTVTATDSGGSFDAENARDVVGAALAGVGNISVSVNDAADSITISTTATQNSTDAALRARSSHTGTQPASTITGLGAVATSNDYEDLDNKPEIPESAGDIGAATTTQGDKADSAVQPGDLGTVATSNDYNDLIGKPTIGNPTYVRTQAYLDANPTLPDVPNDSIVIITA